jgi:3-oxoacyl-[acyl-carrier protein] reductase
MVSKMPSPVTLSLEGRAALVTGGSRGIGAATVKMFVEAGARVAFSYRRASHEAKRLAGECGKQRCFALEADLSGEDSGRDLVHAAVQLLGRLDVAVVNHGIWPPEGVPIDRMTEEQWSRTIAVNLDGAFGVVKHAVAQMKKQALQGPAAGHIVMVSSTAGQRGEAFHCDYAASKGALVSMTKGLSTELASDRIYVNCVAPGWVATDMAEPALAEAASREAIFRTIPLGRVATPEEIAGPILFLCTEHAGFITGEIFNVNGGSVLTG